MNKYKQKIPDLNSDPDQITLDHCYVLLTRLSEAMDLMDGTQGRFKDLIENFDPTLIQEDLQEYLSAAEFSRLFQSELGKGILVGFYFKELWLKLKGDRNEEEDDN